MIETFADDFGNDFGRDFISEEIILGAYEDSVVFPEIVFHGLFIEARLSGVLIGNGFIALG